MSASASTIFDRIASQWSTDPDKSAYITEARGQTSLTFYCDNTELAVALRAAHNMAIDKTSIAGQTSGGEIASKREGDLAISYHKASSDQSGNAYLDKTNYGVRLKGLRAGSGSFVGVAGVGNTDLS